MVADRVALVKGEGKLPPLTQRDCCLVVRAAFLPRTQSPPCAVPQLVGWFDPVTRRPCLVERVDGGHRQTAVWQTQGESCRAEVGTVGWVNFSCRAVLPAFSPVPPPLPVSTNESTLHVALAGAHGEVWHDGYLMHTSERGEVLSLLSTPGEARLYVPQTSRTARGIGSAAVVLPRPAHYLRLCLRAQLAAFCRRYEGRLTIALDDTSLSAMVCVVLISSWRDIAITASRLTPAWTRLLQNLGVLVRQEEARLAVSALSQFVPAAAVQQIAQDINHQAAVIPAKATRQA